MFQFPVIYDTMTVYDNLAFPLRNRGRDEDIVKQRVTAIAEMLEVTDMLNTRAANLSPDNKQKNLDGPRSRSPGRQRRDVR